MLCVLVTLFNRNRMNLIAVIRARDLRLPQHAPVDGIYVQVT